MGKIVISENVSLDGVVEDPTGVEGFRHGGWFERMSERDRAAWVEIESAEAMSAEALLFGRRSYAEFAGRWASRPGEWADRMNSLPKYVVSSTLQDPAWSNSRVLSGDVMAAVAMLKQQVDGDIVVYASGQLAQTLMEHDQVDELRLMIFPVVLGAGKRLFGETSHPMSLRLMDTRTVGDGLASLTYEVIR